MQFQFTLFALVDILKSAIHALRYAVARFDHADAAYPQGLALVVLNTQLLIPALAMRTGVEDVDILATMLIQAERFGTSIAASLRVQSDQLRTKRRQRAEEEAAKIALKLLFPLIFFIFPSLLVVLMGPAFLQIYRVLLPSMGSGS